MGGVLVVTAMVLLGINVLLAAGLMLYRLRLARIDRRKRQTEDRLRPLALGLVEGDRPETPGLTLFEAGVFAELLTRYARRLTGVAQERLTDFFEADGHVDAQLRLLDSPRSWRRATAAAALGDMGSVRATDPLVAHLLDSDRDVRSAAARSLGQLCATSAVGALVRCMVQGTVPRIVAGDALLAMGPAAAPELRLLLAHDQPQIRERAAELLGSLGRPSDTAALLESLRDTSAEVRAKAARALGRLGDERASTALRETLADRVPFVRVASCHSLGAMKDQAAVPSLLTLAQTDSFDAAKAAAQALASIDPETVLQVAATEGASPHLHEKADVIAMASRS